MGERLITPEINKRKILSCTIYPPPTEEGLGERPMNFKEGEVLYFNKPLGWTSFKVVGHARYHICRRIKEKKLKVGHAGTPRPACYGG